MTEIIEKEHKKMRSTILTSGLLVLSIAALSFVVIYSAGEQGSIGGIIQRVFAVDDNPEDNMACACGGGGGSGSDGGVSGGSGSDGGTTNGGSSDGGSGAGSGSSDGGVTPEPEPYPPTPGEVIPIPVYPDYPDYPGKFPSPEPIPLPQPLPPLNPHLPPSIA